MASRSGTQDPVGPVDHGYLRTSAIQWAKVTDDLDQVDLALTMTALREELDPGWADAPRARARLLLLDDRPAEAMTVVRAAGLTLPPEPAPLAGPDLVVAAVHAANGDDDCHHRLLDAMRLVEGGTQRWPVAYLLAAVARARGENAEADQIWLDLVDGLGIVTPLTLSRSAAARVRRRSGPDAGDQVVATVLNFQSHSPVDDPGPVIGAAEQLRAQGDPGGARLLLWATTRIHGPVPAVQAALAALTPNSTRYRLRAGFALVLALLLIPFGVLGLPLILLGREYWNRRVAIPGLSPADSRAWRRIGALPLRPGRNVLEPTDGVSAAEALTFGLLGGLGFAATAAALDSTAGTSWGTVLVALVWLTGLVAWPAAGVAVMRRAGRRRDRRAYWAQQQARVPPVPDQQPCQCRRATVLRGARARAYVDGHLRPAAFAGSDPVRAILGPDATLAVCPDTQIVWLGMNLRSDRSGHAFRGAEPVIEPGAAEEFIGGATERGGPRAAGRG